METPSIERARFIPFTLNPQPQSLSKNAGNSPPWLFAVWAHPARTTGAASLEMSAGNEGRLGPSSAWDRFRRVAALMQQSRGHAAAFSHLAIQQLANAIARQKRRQQGAPEFRTAARFFAGPPKQLRQDRPNRALPGPSLVQGFANFAELNFRHHAEDMIFTFEIIEESALANIGCFGDVFHRPVWEGVLGEDLKSAAKQPQAGFSSPALPPAHALQMR